MKYLLWGFIVLFSLVLISNSVSAVLFTKGPFYVGDEITLEGQVECIDEKNLDEDNHRVQIGIVDKDFKPWDKNSPPPCSNIVGSSLVLVNKHTNKWKASFNTTGACPDVYTVQILSWDCDQGESIGELVDITLLPKEEKPSTLEPTITADKSYESLEQRTSQNNYDLSQSDSEKSPTIELEETQQKFKISVTPTQKSSFPLMALLLAIMSIGVYLKQRS